MGIFDKLFGGSKSPSPSAPSIKQIPKIPQPSPELTKQGRTAWVWELTDGEGATDSTRTGGRAMMGENETWPSCGNCQNPLTFMMQCNLDALPDGMTDHDSGVLRFFYCMHEDCVGMGGWDAFDPQHHLSVLNGDGHFQTAPEGTFAIKPQFVSDTIKTEDFPHWPDRQGLELPESDTKIHALSGHKYAGWPHWIQGAERPNCPDCSAVMEPFIQLDQDWNRDFNFGGGIGHISQCRTHKDNFAFGWACG